MGGKPSRGTSADKRLGANKATPSPKLTAAKRNALPASKFGLPKTKQYPLDTAGRARDALSRVSANGTSAQRAEVRRNVAKAYPSIAVSGTKKSAPKRQSHGDG